MADVARTWAHDPVLVQKIPVQNGYRLIESGRKPMKTNWKSWRRGWESNPRIKVLQTSPLPLGYRAKALSIPKFVIV